MTKVSVFLSILTNVVHIQLYYVAYIILHTVLSILLYYSVVPLYRIHYFNNYILGKIHTVVGTCIYLLNS